MKDGCLVDPGTLARASSFFVHTSLIQATFAIARLMLCVTTWALSPRLQAPKYLFDTGQSLESPPAKIVIVPGKKNKNHSRSDKQHRMSKYVVSLLSTPCLVI